MAGQAGHRAHRASGLPGDGVGRGPAGLRRERGSCTPTPSSGPLEVPAHLARQRHGGPVPVPRPGRVGRRLHSGAPGSRRPAPRTSGGSTSRRRCGSEAGQRPGTSLRGGRPGRRGHGGPPALSRLAGLAHPGRARPGRRGRRPPGSRRGAPDLTVLVPAYREAGVIAAKIEDLRANGYPGALDILVVADGDPETAEAAGGPAPGR